MVEVRRLRLERLLQVMSRHVDLRLEFGDQDRLSEDHITLGASPKQAAALAISVLKGHALRLLGHYLAQNWEWAEAAQWEDTQAKPHFSTLWYALENARVENVLARRWPGADRYFQARLLPNLGGDLLARMPVLAQLEAGIYFFGRRIGSACLRRDVQLALEDMKSEILRGAQAESARESYLAMQAIYPGLAHLIKAVRAKTATTAEKREELKVEENERRKEEEIPESSPEINLTDELFTAGAMGLQRPFPEWYRPGSAPWFERGLGKKEIHPSVDIPFRHTIAPAGKGEMGTYRQLVSEVQKEAGYLRQRLTAVLREELYLRFGGYYRTGKLNMPKLWKQRIGNYRLFQRRLSGGNRSAAFILLVDESASMKGQAKIRTAQKAALLLGETLDSLGVPIEIIGYSTSDFESKSAMKLGLTPAYRYRTMRCSKLEHRIYKSFDEPYFLARARLTEIQPRHNNWDEEHLLFAYQRIQGRPEDKKVIIVICDGQPNGDADHLIRTVKRVESSGCNVIGVGIGADFINQIYRRAVVVKDVRQMAEELLKELAEVFRSNAALPG